MSSSEPMTPLSLSAFLPPMPPMPHQYTQIIHSIQRRSVDRVSDDGTFTPSTFPDSAALQDLEADLRLAAQVGQALLEEKGDLDRKLGNAESANQKLLDRLTSSVKESSQLQRRLEEAVGNLEQAESNNRALLVALEEDRKKISRLTTEAARLGNTSTQLKTLTRAHQDLQQELASEHKRAAGAEARNKKQGERMTEMEDRLRRAIEDLEEIRQDKVLRTRKSHDALARARARLSSSAPSNLLHSASAAAAGNPEAIELLKLVESLVTENDGLRAQTLELHELLDDSREEQSGLRSAMADGRNLGDGDEDHMLLDGEDQFRGRRNSSVTPTLLSEVLMSPSESHSFSDLDGFRSLSPFSTSTNPNSLARSWAPSSTLCSRVRLGERPASSRSISPADERPTYFQQHLPSSINSATGAALAAATAKRKGMAAVGSGKVPFGRGHNRRALSMDVNSVARQRVSTGSAPSSPMIPASPPAGTPVSDAPVRPKRQPRPLSLSLGPSLFPLVPEDAPRVYSRHSHQPSSSVAVSISTTGGDTDPHMSYHQSGLSFSSPKKPKRMREDTSSAEEDLHNSFTVKVDASTQTSSPLMPTFLPTMSTPRRRQVPSLDSRTLSPMGASDVATSPPSTSEHSEGDREKAIQDFGLPPGSMDARTAVLGTLIEHTNKLLIRVQSADIGSQEKRLKKHNLPGDVRHLAQANLKDLLNDIEGLRTHFRRVLEQERSTAAKENNSSHSEPLAESLVVRRDFVSLVKLFRDLLFETSRLRSLVNRIELEPILAHSLRDLDILNVVDPEFVPKAVPGLLAPLSRLFSSAISSETTPVTTKANSATSRIAARPIVKISGSSALSSATVNVEFGKNAVRRAVAVEDEGSPDVNGSSFTPPQVGGHRGSLGRVKSDTQVKRDLSSIFAGGMPPQTSRGGLPDSWVVVSPTGAPASRVSSNPFGRLFGAYRPAMSSTTNAVLDSLPHAPQADIGYAPTLLERQLRPRGLSDSSIKSTFVAHANPHHRVITPATLALSSEARLSTTGPFPTPIIISGGGSAGDTTQQLSDLSSSLARKPSRGKILKAKSSQAQLRQSSTPSSTTSEENAVPPIPSRPIPMSSTPAVVAPIGIGPSSPGVSASLFGNLTNWASRAAILSPLAKADLADGETETMHWSTGADRGGRHLG